MTGSMALSSRGLGRRPLTAVTRVRIPLGLPLLGLLRFVLKAFEFAPYLRRSAGYSSSVSSTPDELIIVVGLG